MKPDKDKPRTWIQFKDGYCNDCMAGCCTMPVEVKATDLVLLGFATEDEVALSEKKLAKRLLKEKIISSYRETTGLFTLMSRPNGDCFLLDPLTRKCSKYSLRPEVCRLFPAIGPRPGYCPKISK